MNTRTSIIFHGYFALCLLLFSGISHATPAVKWTPKKLVLEQMQGTLSKYIVTIESTEDVEGVAARVVPELQPWVTVYPTHIGNLFKGDQVDITVNINIPPDEIIGTSVEGVIQLKQPQFVPSKTIAMPLPVNLTITQFIDRGLPPDPGEAGTQTLLGIDSDRDGVRDDIQRYIHLTYPNEPLLRLALREYAKQFQLLLPTADNKDEAYNNARKMSRHRECIHFIRGKVEKHVISGLKAEILNTRDRSIAYIKYSDNLAGQILYSNSDWNNSCAFDVNSVGGGL